MTISVLAWSESFAFVSSLAISEAAVVAGIKSDSSTGHTLTDGVGDGACNIVGKEGYEDRDTPKAVDHT